MTNQEKMAILMGIYNILFQSKQDNTDITTVGIMTNMGKFPGRWFVNNTLRGFDVDINAGNKIVEIRCIEQNPNKVDNSGNLKKHANLAQQGHKIMWVIDRKGSWLGHIMDGVWIPTFEAATQAANLNIHNVIYTPVGNTGAAKEQVLPSNAPEIAGHVSYEQDLANSIVPKDLPEMPHDMDIPEYVLQSVTEMEEPPDWGDYE